MAIIEQRMHASRQVRSVTLPPEIQPVFLDPQRLTRARRGPGRAVGSVAENTRI